MNCEFNNLLSRYHDRELTEPQRVQVQAHLRDCPACAAELEQMQSLSQSLRSAAAEAMPRASAEFLTRLQAMAPQVERHTVFRFVKRLTAAAAAILVAASIPAVVQWAMHRQPPVQPARVQTLNPEERVVLDPDSAVVSAGEDSAMATDVQVDFIPLESSGGRQ